jgi:hypothetical protein
MVPEAHSVLCESRQSGSSIWKTLSLTTRLSRTTSPRALPSHQGIEAAAATLGAAKQSGSSSSCPKSWQL